MESLIIFLIVMSPYSCGITIVALAFKALNRNIIIYKNPYNTGMFLLFLCSLLSGITNKNIYSIAASFIFIVYLAISIYIQNSFISIDKIENILKKVMLFAVFSTLIGFYEKISINLANSIKWGMFFAIPSYESLSSDYRIYSTFGNPNIAGTWFSLFILISFYFYNKTEFKNKKIYIGILIYIFIFALYLTGSRGAALGLLFGLLVYKLLLKSKKSNVFIFIMMSIIVISMFVMPIASQYLPSKSSDTTISIDSSMIHDIDTSVNSRQEIWKDCYRMFTLKPIAGWGLMGVYFASRDVYHYVTREPHAHNLWLMFACSLGFIGFILYLFTRKFIYEKLFLLYINDCPLVPLLASVQALILGQCVVDFTIMAPQGGIIFFSTSAMITSLSLQYTTFNQVYKIPTILLRKKAFKINL